MKKTIYILAGLLIFGAVLAHAFTKQSIRQELVLSTDSNKRPLQSAFRQSNYIDRVNLTKDTIKRITAPASAAKVVFSSTADFYLRIGGDEEYYIVASDVTKGYAFELIKAVNGAIRTLNIASQELIGMVAPASAVVTMMFYRK